MDKPKVKDEMDGTENQVKPTDYYKYLLKGKFKDKKKPLKLKDEWGFFATRKDGSYGEVHWNDSKDKIYVIRGDSQKALFGWLHNEVPIFAWGNIRIERIEY